MHNTSCGSSETQLGFSDKINDPSFRNAQKKMSRATGIFGALLIVAPIAVALVLGIKDDNLSYLGIGGAVSLIFLIVNLISAARKRLEKSWDGAVIGQDVEQRRHRNAETKEHITYSIYVTRLKRDDGRIAKIEESESNIRYYSYLKLGDRVRYHPEFGGFYEKYDKTRDSYVYCPACGTQNDISQDVCARCGMVLLK